MSTNWKGLLRPAGLFALAAVAGCSGDDVFRAPSGSAPGDLLLLTSGNRLISVNGATTMMNPAIPITGLQAGETLIGIDVRPGGSPAGALYAVSDAGRVYTINVSTGAATLRSTLAPDPSDTTDPFTGLSGTSFGVDFNPVADRLRIVSDTGQNLRINVDTGATITDGTLRSGGVTRTGIAAAAYTNSFAAACRTTLFFLDSTTDRLVVTNDPNGGTVTDVGPLGVDIDGVNGFEIVSRSDGSTLASAVINVSGAPSLYTINLTTGAASSTGVIFSTDPSERIVGMASVPPATAPAQAVGNVLAVTESNRLVSFNDSAPQKVCTSAQITGLQGNETVLGIDVRPATGDLVALGSTGRLYTIDPATGVATPGPALVADPSDVTNPFAGLDGIEFGVDFNPVPDRLRVVSDTGQNLRINVDNGATITDGIINPPGSSITAVAYTNSFAGATSTTLYVLDAANDRLMIQGLPSGNPNTGDVQAVGPLGVDVQPVAAFEINGANNKAIAVLNPPGATSSDLYTIDLTTGAATRVNTIGVMERVRALTYANALRAKIVAVTSDNQLVTFDLATPGTYESAVPISGLQGGENILGIDIRPADGRLYAVTDAERLYTLDSASGTATPVSSLIADAGDLSNPYAGLVGTSFGVDFNPTVDRLRIVSDAQQNLRVNVDTGATITDGALTGVANIVAAAYTQSFAGATTTQLFVLDSALDRLMLLNPPNDGVLTPIGPLGVSFGPMAAFDIAGGQDGLSLAALQNGAAQSSLYQVNLATGAATAIANIGPPGSQPVQAIAIRLQ